MQIYPIRTDQDYRAALKALAPLFDCEPEPGTPEGDYFDIMLTLVEAYEAKHFPVNLPNPVDAIKFRMEQSEQLKVPNYQLN
jgi:HTH-type transcriptional regulator/antitoxin HigA